MDPLREPRSESLRELLKEPLKDPIMELPRPVHYRSRPVWFVD